MKIPSRNSINEDHPSNRNADNVKGLVIIVKNHAAQGGGGALARIVSAENTTKEGTYNIGSYKGDSYTIDGFKFEAVDVLTGKTYTGDTTASIISLALPKQGAEYRLYQLQHQKGDDDWVDVGPMIQSRHFSDSWYGKYEGHENRRLKMHKATYLGQEEDYMPEEVVKTEMFTCRLPSDEDGIDKHS